MQYIYARSIVAYLYRCSNSIASNFRRHAVKLVELFI